MPWSVAVITLVACLATLLATRMLIPVLQALAVVDHPNERSSHAAPTPRGGGIALVAIVVSAWLAIALGLAEEALWRVAAVSGAGVVLAIVSWFDDRRGLSPWLRLGVQALAVAAGLATLSSPGGTFQGLLPAWLDLALAGLAWLWFVNLTNFMDGIDGLSGVEFAAIALGVIIIAWFIPFAGIDSLGLHAAALLGAVAGFLVWNWPPAKVFLGDSGSVPLGFFGGWLLLELAGAGLWVAPLIVPAYYWADATLTLLRRLSRGERLTEAHRSHFFQRAARAWGSHLRVTLSVAALNLVLIAIAFWSETERRPWWGLVIAALATTAVLIVFRRARAS
jgi:UDP-N-acetylmuramyl pentapeptide phosphotransferase/UDP-N-acetylglucosamine-1-phosphate transferase